MSQNFSRNIFTNIPVEYLIPKKTKVVFVSDYFESEVQGGAELTSGAIIKKCPHRLFKLHSASVTPELLNENRDKYWIFGNYVSMSSDIITYLPDSGVRYSIIEFDFKYCAFRSEQRHLSQTGQPCSCARDVHGLNIAKLMHKADHIFWMSEGQKKLFQKALPSLDPDGKQSVIQSSTFDDETLDYLKKLSEKRTKSELTEKKVFSVLGSGSWIKGVEETKKWCLLNRKNYRILPALPYRQFLDEMSKGYGFIFLPLDWDTCPRVVLEGKLMGLEELVLNDNVLNKTDSWFSSSTRNELDAYLRGRADHFWKVLESKIGQ